MSAIVPWDDEQIPLKWVNNIVGKRLLNVLKTIDAIPCHSPHYPQWRMARAEAQTALNEIHELKRLAKWLGEPVADHYKTIKTGARPVCAQRRAKPGNRATGQRLKLQYGRNGGRMKGDDDSRTIL